MVSNEADWNSNGAPYEQRVSLYAWTAPAGRGMGIPGSNQCDGDDHGWLNIPSAVGAVRSRPSYHAYGYPTTDLS